MRKTLQLGRSITTKFFLPMGVVLVMQAAALRMLSIPERVLPSPGFHDLPFVIGGWKAVGEQSMEASVATYLKPDDYIIRDYLDAQSGREVNLFLAYFRSLQNTYGPHSPSVCLPGAGWLVRSSKVTDVSIPGRPEGIPVREYMMEKSGNRILVIYWYQNNRDIWAEEFHAKLKLLPDLIRYRRSDVSLVRLITSMPVEKANEELASTQQFARSIFGLLEARFASQ
jgi:EpsI family protein